MSEAEEQMLNPKRRTERQGRTERREVGGKTDNATDNATDNEIVWKHTDEQKQLLLT